MRIFQKIIVTISTAAVTFSGLAFTAATASAASLPKKGECYNINYEQIKPTPWDETATPVPCNGPHTVEIFASGPIPSSDTSKEAINTRTKFCTLRAAMKASGTKFSTYANNPPNIGNYTFTFGNGANYVCSVGMQDYKKANLPSVRLIDSPLRTYIRNSNDNLLICKKGSEATWKSHTLKTINCDKPHDWSVTGYIYVGNADTSKYPGEANIKAKVSQYCPGAWYYYPVKSDWAKGTGERYITCFQKGAY